jgi:DNA-binding NarL/FixJ family response regulator
MPRPSQNGTASQPCHARSGLKSDKLNLARTLQLPTVRNHVSSIFSKLQVADRAQAVIRARDAGLG